MSRKAIHIILPCLLYLFPALLCAQTLTRLEYWFDDNYAKRRNVSLNGSDVTVVRSIDTDGLDNGVHKICFRALRSDGMCTAISSSLFFKQYSNSGENFEYWLDDDYSGRISMNLANTEEEQELSLDLSDEQQCPFGFHQLHFRVAQAGKGMSATYTTGIWKRQLGNVTQLEYWFDDDMENSKILNGKLASTGDDYIFNTDIDVSTLSVGLHRFNYRPCDSETNLFGMVQSATILKVPAGKATQLEYWFDEDIKNSKLLEGKLASTGDAYIFNTDIDASTLSVGLHRLNYRPCDRETNLFGMVQSATILKVPAGNATQLEYWFDEDIKNSKILDGKLASTGDAYIFNTDIDASTLSVGVHRINYRPCDSETNLFGIVQSATILKVPTGKATQLEYWIDDDFAHRKTINGKLASDNQDYLFVNDLDLGDVSPGHHRFNCRAVSNSKLTTSAVISENIILKSISGSNAKITCYTMSIDEDIPATFYLDEPTNEIFVERTIDATFLDDGEHELAMTFWNDSENSVTDISKFIVDFASEKLATPDPSTFKAIEIYETGFTATWAKVEGATLYDIRVVKMGDETHTVYFGGGTEPRSKITGLEPNTSYLFQVRARNNKPRYNSDWSAYIANEVKTKQEGWSEADIAIHSIEGFDGSTTMFVGNSYHYYVWVVNKGSNPWQGSFELRDGDDLIYKWKNIRISSKTVQALDCYYTPMSAGTKAIVLYYLNRGVGSGVPVNTKDNASNIMLVSVKNDYTYNKYLNLASIINCPETVQRGEKVDITTNVINRGELKWTGKLYIMDNGVPIGEKDVSLSPGESTPLIVKNWMPETLGEHQIGAYYQTSNAIINSLVTGHEFPNPKLVTVEGDAIKVTLAYVTHVTKDVVPKEVTEESEVYYSFRFTDEHGNRLKGLKMQFDVTGSSTRDIVETSTSDDNGIAVLRIQTEGNAAIAEEGETAIMSYSKLMNEKNQTIQFKTTDEDIELKIHQRKSADFAGVENLESIEFTLNLGASVKGDLFNLKGFKFSLNGSLNRPFSFTRNYKDLADSEPTVSIQTGIEGKIGGKFDFFEYANVGGGVKGGLTQTTTFDMNSRNTPLAVLMGYTESIMYCSNNRTMRSIRALESWFNKKFRNGSNDENRFYDDCIIWEDTYNDAIWGYNFKGEFDFLKIMPKGIGKIGGLKLPSWIGVDKLKAKGEAAFTFEPDKKRFKNGRYLYGNSREIKGELGGEYNILLHDMASPQKGWWKKAAGMTDFYNKFNQFLKDTDESSESALAYSWKEEEMYSSEERKHLVEVSNTYEIQTAHTWSLNNLRKYISNDWMKEHDGEDDENSSAYMKLSNTIKYKMSSQGDWVTRMENFADINEYNKTIVGHIYPQFSSHHLIDYFWKHKKIWEDSNILGNLMAIPSGGEFDLKDAFKISMQNSSELEGNLSIPIASWKMFTLSFDVGFSLKADFFPSETFYSVADKCFLPVVLRPTATLEHVTKWFTNGVRDRISNLFNPEDGDELDKEYEEMGQRFEFKPVHSVATALENKKSSHIYNVNSARIRCKHPMIAQNLQKDICNLRFTINDGMQNYEDGTIVGFEHYYPAGCQFGLTEEGDTLFVISEVCELYAIHDNDTLKTTHQGKMKLDTYIGTDDLTPFGFSETQPLDVYYSKDNGEIWRNIGPAGTTLLVDSLGAYMLGIPISNDIEAPQITALLDEETGLMHINITDNIGMRVNTLQVLVNGELKEVNMVNQSSFELLLSAEEMQYMLAVYITVEDLAGNQGSLFQVFNMDKPDNIETTKQTDGKTKILLNKRMLSVEGAQPGSTVTVYSMNGFVVTRNQVDATGHLHVKINGINDGVYIVTLSNGKSKKFYVK